jgi:two-component system, chemotaxis family, protein-glutamate methylesterase/glutaminase
VCAGARVIRARADVDGPPLTFNASISGLAIYLDNFSVVRLATKDPSRRRRFLDVVHSGADLIFSLTNVAEVSGFQGRSLDEVRQFLDDIGPHWFPAELDPTKVTERELAGMRTEESFISIDFMKQYFASRTKDCLPASGKLIDLSEQFFRLGAVIDWVSPQRESIKKSTAALDAALIEKIKAYRTQFEQDPQWLDQAFPVLHGESFKPARIYIAPPDNHLLIKKNKILVTKGARENRSRPGIDPLFRSAAVTHGASVIGVVLTGMLDDGTAGLVAIKKCGGVIVVQDPKGAAYREMPQSVLDNLKVDYCVPISEMGRLLEKLVHERPGKSKGVPEDVRTEAIIAERVLSDVGQVNGLGNQVPYNCPNCGGVLWEINNPDIRRFRCHTGHSFTESALLTSQSEKIEETLWISLRMFEERKNLLNSMAHRDVTSKRKSPTAQRAKETQVHIERIKAMLRASQQNTWKRTVADVEKEMSKPRIAASARDCRLERIA